MLNTAPAFIPPTPGQFVLEATAGAPVSFTVRASDPDASDVIALTVSGLPGGASFPIPSAANPVESTFTWTPGAAQLGTFNITFAATDSRGLAGTPRIVQVLVRVSNRAPVFESPPTPVSGSSFAIAAGAQLTFRVEAVDPDGDPVEVALTTPLPESASFAPAVDPAHRVFSWTPSPAQVRQDPYLISFVARDAKGLSSEARSVSIAVVAPPTPTFSVRLIARAGDEPVPLQLSCTADAECAVQGSYIAGCGAGEACSVNATGTCGSGGACRFVVLASPCVAFTSCTQSIDFSCASGAVCGAEATFARVPSWTITLSAVVGASSYPAAATRCQAGAECLSSLTVPRSACGGDVDCLVSASYRCDAAGNCSLSARADPCGALSPCAVEQRFECTLLDSNCSIGLRLPVLAISSQAPFSEAAVQPRAAQPAWSNATIIGLLAGAAALLLLSGQTGPRPMSPLRGVRLTDKPRGAGR